MTAIRLTQMSITVFLDSDLVILSRDPPFSEYMTVS